MADKAQIVAAVRDAGVVGAGGAGFPTHLKLSASVGVVLVNGAECEPLLRVDQSLAELEAGKSIEGLVSVMTAVGALRAIFGLKAKYHGAVDAVKRAISARGLDEAITVGVVPDVYPAGDEHVLVYELTGKVVPQGALPLAVGALVVNVETLCNVADALAGVPVTDTWLTVGGAVLSPMTVRAPIGMAMSEVIALAGGPTAHDCALIEGGPMMGHVVDSWTEPITKLTKGLLLLPWSSPVVQEKRGSLIHAVKRTAGGCDQCRNCTDLCPRYLLGHSLEPHVILRAVNNGLPVEGLLTQASLCSECGLCSLVACPAFLWPRRVNAELRSEFRRQGYPFKMQSEPIAGPRPERAGRQLPTKRLIHLLGLSEWNVPAPVLASAPAPAEVRIALKQHAGSPAVPVVRVGDTVARGQLIGEAGAGVSARVSASISGTVTEVSTHVSIRRSGKV